MGFQFAVRSLVAAHLTYFVPFLSKTKRRNPFHDGHDVLDEASHLRLQRAAGSKKLGQIANTGRPAP